MGGVVALGECMVELGLAGAGQGRIGYAGDTFNTAVYLSRLGLDVAYATAVGADDPFSGGILKLMGEEQVSDALVARIEGRLPGLYAIERDEAGERRFFYWRGEAAVRDFFRVADVDALLGAMRAADLVFLSGVTLAVIGAGGRASLLELLKDVAARGVAVGFDPNHRPRLWANAAEARAATEAVIPLCRYVSVSGPDAEAMCGQPAEAVAQAWASEGAEVIRREEDRTVAIHAGGAVQVIPAGPGVKQVVDTTGAGDSFNGGYLAARLGGADAGAAVEAGRRLAAVVVQHPGAIIPRAAMP